jgi:hypothetical protein
MQNSEVKRLHDIVRHILEKIPKTRECDHQLYAFYCTMQKGHFNLEMFLNYKTFGLSSFESISRARRRVQADFPHLQDNETKKKRAEMEQKYREYYGGRTNA